MLQLVAEQAVNYSAMALVIGIRLAGHLHCNALQGTSAILS
jgi:hypothetical protein